MRSPRFIFGWALLLLLGPGLLRPAAAGEVARLTEGFSLESTEVLRITLPVGAVRFFPEPRDRGVMVVMLSCSGDYYPCRERADQVSLLRETGDGGVRLRLTGPGTWWRSPKAWNLAVQIEVRYPMGASLELDLGQGSVELAGLEADARIEVARGVVRVSLLEQRAGTLDLRVPRGRLLFRDARGRRLGESESPFRSPHQVLWTEGEGPIHLEVRVGKGDVVVELR